MLKTIQFTALAIAIASVSSPVLSQSANSVGVLAKARELQRQAENLELFQLLNAAALDVAVLYQSQPNYRDLSNKVILSPTGRLLITKWDARFSPVSVDGRDGFEIEIRLKKSECNDLMKTGIGINPGPVSAATINGKRRSTYWEKLCTRSFRKNVVELIGF